MYSPIMIEGEHRQGKMEMKETWRELEGGCAEANVDGDGDGMYAGRMRGCGREGWKARH